MNEIPELKGVDMLVSADGVKWVPREVVGRITGQDLPYKAKMQTGPWLISWKYAKPLLRPQDVPPEGYHLATEEEREGETPKGAKYWSKMHGAWRTPLWDRFKPHVIYALPNEPRVLELTMERLSADYGCEVKIVAGKEVSE